MKFSILDWKRGELLFVVGVIVIVAGVSFWQVKLGEVKTRDAQRKADTELVARSLRSYYEVWGSYPAGEGGEIRACGRDGGELCKWGGGEIKDADGVVYLKKLPQDPMADRGYFYVFEPGEAGRSFRIYAGLENRRDAAYKSGLTMSCGVTVQCSWYVEN